MIQYDKGERDLLLNRLVTYIDTETGGINDPHNIPYTFVSIFGERAQISVELLVKIVLYDPATNNEFVRKGLGMHFRILFDLIHAVPIKQVPLYISTVPDVAKWRLEIGR
jgi:hypothetical protein